MYVELVLNFPDEKLHGLKTRLTSNR
jgi:hypothetical protein